MRAAFLNGVAPIAVQHVLPSHREPDYTPVNKQYYTPGRHSAVMRRFEANSTRLTSQLVHWLIKHPTQTPLLRHQSIRYRRLSQFVRYQPEPQPPVGQQRSMSSVHSLCKISLNNPTTTVDRNTN